MAEIQRLRCRVAFHALQFRPEIQMLGRRMVHKYVYLWVEQIDLHLLCFHVDYSLVFLGAANFGGPLKCVILHVPVFQNKMIMWFLRNYRV